MITKRCFILGPERRYLFAFVPKVACTNWKCLIRHTYGFEDYLDPKLAHDRKAAGIVYLTELENPYDPLVSPSCKRITCVRNPYSRALSAYLDKIEPFTRGEDRPGGPALRQIFEMLDAFRKLCFPAKSAVDFECFVAWLDLAAAGENHVLNLHWIPQTFILGTGQVRYDFIARFENLAQDAPKALAMMGCDAPFPSQREVKFPPNDATAKMRAYYTPAIIERVARVYQADFAFLNYDPDAHPLA